MPRTNVEIDPRLKRELEKEDETQKDIINAALRHYYSDTRTGELRAKMSKKLQEAEELEQEAEEHDQKAESLREQARQRREEFEELKNRLDELDEDVDALSSSYDDDLEGLVETFTQGKFAEGPVNKELVVVKDVASAHGRSTESVVDDLADDDRLDNSRFNMRDLPTEGDSVWDSLDADSDGETETDDTVAVTDGGE